MFKRLNGIYSIAFCFVLAFLILVIWGFAIKAQPVLAGSGPTINIPLSTTAPTLDGVCNPAEYSDAVVVTVTVGTTHPFPVYMKRTSTDVYFCFGNASGLPLPVNNSASSVAVYIDPDNEMGSVAQRDDFGIWMPYSITGTAFANSWITNTYKGPVTVGWQAVKYQTASVWTVEFKIPYTVIGNTGNTVGLALFYQWWQAPSNDYSWPADGIWANPPAWATAIVGPKIPLPDKAFLPAIEH